MLENRGGFRRPLEEIFNRSPAIRTSAQAQCLRAQRGEPYHLIIVGADITGLAAAHFNRPHARSNRILFSIITMTRRSRQAQRIDPDDRLNLMSGTSEREEISPLVYKSVALRNW